MQDFLVTEYKEKRESDARDFNSAPDAEYQSAAEDNIDEMIMTFMEGSDELEQDLDQEELESSLIPEDEDEVLFLDPEDVVQFSELGDTPELGDVDEDEIMDGGDSEAMGFQLPGAVNYVEEPEPEPEPEEPKVTDWNGDRDPAHFMSYITEAYPAGIPTHDGTSTLGCERAILYLTKLNKEISEALRADEKDVLDLQVLERIRVSMVRDVMKLKEHVKKINKRLKRASIVLDALKDDTLTKEAGSPKVQLVMTPFERAITGIIINATVSAGKPLEDVYEYLKAKYTFTDREELSVMQLLMDMGQPIYKDRGTIGDKDSGHDEGHGVEFLKNYFS